ncbi:hypothetical protein Tco_0282754 [Tanacetum coccineum]
MSSSNHPIIVPSDSDIEDAFSSINVNVITITNVDSRDFFPSKEDFNSKVTKTTVESPIPYLLLHQVGSLSTVRYYYSTTDYPFVTSYLRRMLSLNRVTSTSAQHQLCQDAIWQLVANCVDAALEA